MKELAKEEMEKVRGGNASECARLEYVANTRGKTMTDPEWEAWINAYYAVC